MEKTLVNVWRFHLRQAKDHSTVKPYCERNPVTKFTSTLFLLRCSTVPLLVWRMDIVTEVSHGFPQPLKSKCPNSPSNPATKNVLYIFLIHYLLIIHSFDVYNSAYHLSVFSVFHFKQKKQVHMPPTELHFKYPYFHPTGEKFLCLQYFFPEPFLWLLYCRAYYKLNTSVIFYNSCKQRNGIRCLKTFWWNSHIFKCFLLHWESLSFGTEVLLLTFDLFYCFFVSYQVACPRVQSWQHRLMQLLCILFLLMTINLTILNYTNAVGLIY